MPDANVIESYQGDKNLAFGSNALPAASTDAVLDFSPSIKAWSDYAQNKLLVAREQQAQLKAKQLQAQADLQKKLDVGSYKIWDADRDAFNKLYNDAAKLTVDVAKRGKWEDINDPDYNKAIKMWGDLDQFAQFSTQQQTHYDVGDKEFAANRNKFQDTSRGSLDSYKNVSDPIKRASMDYNLDPKIGFDLSKYYPIVLKRLEQDNPTLTATGQPDRFGYGRYTHQGQLNVAGATEIAEGAWSGDPDATDFGQHLIDTGQSQATNPHDAFVQNFVEATVPQSLAEEIKGVNYAPTDVRNPQAPIQQQPNFPVTVAVANPDAKVVKISKNGTTVFKVKDPSGNDIELKDANGDKITNSFATEKEAQNARRSSGGYVTGNVENAWLPSKTADFPSNLPIIRPAFAYDTYSNTQLTPDEIKSGVWTVDLADVEDWHRDKNTKELIFQNDYNNLSADKKDNYEKVRLATVKLPNGNSYRIPYDKNISVPLTNALAAAKVDFKLPPLDVSVPLGDTPSKQQGQQSAQKKKGDRLQIGAALFTIQDIKEVNGTTYYKTERGWVDASKL